MLEAICAHLHNFFTDDTEPLSGSWTIKNGTIDLSPYLIDGQYFRVMGSVFNDGVYQYPAEGLLDETFTGEIWPMKVPKAVKELAAEISEWVDKYGAVMASPLTSESVIGVYSYTKASGSGGGMDADAWKDAFKSRLNPWRKLR